MKKPDEEGGGADLKATVTLSGDALAALLEEVKNIRSASSVEPEAPQPEAEPPLLPEPPADPLPSPRPRIWQRFR